jgi:hypothetical protein
MAAYTARNMVRGTVGGRRSGLIGHPYENSVPCPSFLSLEGALCGRSASVGGRSMCCGWKSTAVSVEESSVANCRTGNISKLKEW